MEIAGAFGFVLLMMAIGRLLAWRAIVPETAPNTLNMVVLYVCLPAAILQHAPKLRFEVELLALVAVPWILLGLGAALVWGVSRVLRIGRAEQAVLYLLVVLGNTSFLGFAIIPALAGEGVLRYAVVYDQFGSFMQLSTYGLFVIASFAGDERPSVGTIAKKIIGFPPFLVLIASLTVMPESYPEVIEGALVRLEGALLPLVALAIGMQLRFELPREQLGPLAIGLVGKLIVLPALALGLSFALGLEGDLRAAAVLEAAMPAMITASALASVANLAPQLGAALVGYGIVLGIATLPAWAYLLRLLG